MKRILVLGAGKSAPYLIHWLLGQAQEHDWFVTVGDLDVETAGRRVAGHARGEAIFFDVNDAAVRGPQIERADLVVNFTSPQFLSLVAWDCMAHGTPMICASYRSQELRELNLDAQRQGILLLCEMGLDPGIDHMSAMALVRRIHGEGGRIASFCSYGSGVPAPDQEHNPLRYVITWNPRNVVMAGEAGAQFMEDGKIKIVPYHHVFHHTWRVEVDGVGTLEAYPNRDSLSYMQAFGVTGVHTMIRGTLRYPGWSETWARVVQLGLPSETVRIPDLARRTYAEVVEMFLPLHMSSGKLETRVARFLGISPTGRIIENMRWLGLFSDEPTGCEGDTAAAMLVDVLSRKMPLRDDARDMVVLKHDLDVEYPGRDRAPETVTSTMVVKGEPGGMTAMARTVGLPAALAARMVLTGQLHLTGCHIPTHPSIYEPVLRDLASDGIAFVEQVMPRQPEETP
jgi:saccharopine dehydrogenase-like NADP-dependent oxidoreductase